MDSHRKTIFWFIFSVLTVLLIHHWFVEYPDVKPARTYNYVNDRDKDMICDIVNSNDAILTEIANNLSVEIISEEGAVKQIDATGIKTVSREDSNTIVFTYDNDGFASASWEDGIIYVKDDDINSISRGTCFESFEEYKDGYYSDDGTDNYIYIERIKPQWFYYCRGW